MSFTLSWGVLGCGWISGMFVNDLAIQAVEERDVQHRVAVVGARSKEKAASFIEKHCQDGYFGQGKDAMIPKAVGSYEEVFASKDVDVVYIGTINSTHYDLAWAAISHNKHVLVEKPAVLTALEWKSLTGLAKEKKVFLMEGMWTQFLPLTTELQKQLHELKSIGEVRSVQADFSQSQMNFTPPEHRLKSLDSAGGALLDLGPYILLFAIVALWDSPGNKRHRPDRIVGSMQRNQSGVDVSTTMVLEFEKQRARAVLTCSIDCVAPKDSRAVIIGTKGQIRIHDGLSRITRATIELPDEPLGPRYMKWKSPIELNLPLKGFGLMHEADAVARSIRDGLTENPLWSHAHTAFQMEVFDEVRQQGGYIYPSGLERVA